MYTAKAICFHHYTTDESYCVPCLHNIPSIYYQINILCTLPVIYAPIIIPPKKHIVYHTNTICSLHYTTNVAYCVQYQHNMLPSLYYQRSILCTIPTQYAPIIILPKKHIVYHTNTICSLHYTTKVAY